MSPLLVFLALAQADVALTGARILTGSGRELNPGVVVVRAGKIVSVEEGGRVPEGAQVEDLQGRWILPGLVDAATTAGLRGPANEETQEITPDLRIWDAFDPGSPDLVRIRAGGVTTICLVPGNRNVVGGLCAVAKTDGRLAKFPAALKAALGPGPSAGNFAPRGIPATFFARRPTTRMGVAWELRKALEDARGGPGPLGEVLGGRLPFRASAAEAADIDTLLRLSGDFGLVPVIEEGVQAWRFAKDLASMKASVLLRPPLRVREESDERVDAFPVLLAAGVRTALLPSDGADLRTTMAAALRFGATREQALRAVTLSPAEILGIGALAGSLEPGKDADLVVFSGDPFDLATRVEKTMIGGSWAAGKGTGR